MTQFQFSRRNEASASSDQQRKASGHRYTAEDVFIPFYPLIDKKYIIRRTATITGASVGALAGMTIGSRICPGVGTAIGGVVGGVLGAAGGKKIASKCLR